MFEFLVIQPVFNLLIAIYSIIPGSDFGIALILFTILVRFALYPLVRRQLHQSRVMRQLQPQLAKIKKEAGGNKQLESMQMMNLYKHHGVSPFRSILILLIQLPIFIALFQVIRIFTGNLDRVPELTYGFLEGIEPIQQLIDNPSQFNENLFGFIDLTETAISQGTINFWLLGIAVAAALAQFYMSRQLMPETENKKGLRQIMAEAAEGKQADQSEMNAVVMNKMTRLFPIIMLFVMVGLPGALVLYYAVSNLVAVAQQTYILRHDIGDLEELADEAIAAAPEKKSKKSTKAKSAKAAKTAKPKKQIKSTRAGKSANTKNSTQITRITAKDTRKKRRK